MDVALTFHVGLMMRVGNPSELEAPEEQEDFFPVAWRKWAQAESLIAFVKEAADIIPLSGNVSRPKASDFLGWIDIIGNTIVGGDNAERRCCYLKAIAKSTLELGQWLTHVGNAIRFDAYFAFKATGYVLSVYSLALMRFQFGFLDRCPSYASYRLTEHYRRGGDNENLLFAVCKVCGWEDDPIILEEAEEADEGERAHNESKEDLVECVFVEVPLRGRKPPKPSR